MSTQDKYYRVSNNEDAKPAENEVRVSAKSRAARIISIVLSLFLEKKFKVVFLRGSGAAITTVCTAAEVLR